MSNVQLDIADRIAVVTLDRPPVNALDSATFDELADTFDSLAHRRDVSVAILRASGERAFCGGVDLADSPRRHRADGRSEDGGSQGDAADQVDPGRVARRCFFAIRECAVPVIAAVDAPAIGAGVALVASCDLVFASERAVFALTEINVGVLGGYRHAQRLVGPFKAKRMLLTGERLPASELYRLGAVEAVTAPADLVPAVMATAHAIAAKSPLAVRMAKESANRVEFLDLLDGYRLEQDYTVRINRHADSAEARRAYLEKRDPDFRFE